MHLYSNTAVILSTPSALGHIAVAAQGRRLVGVVFGYRTAGAAIGSLERRIAGGAVGDGGRSHVGAVEETERDEAFVIATLERLERFADGEPVELSDVSVSLDHLTPFGRRVAKACRAIRRGERRTYGDLARTAGAPGAARAVGQVMAGNRTPLVVPCHRVIAAGGRLGGFSAPDGLAMKQRLLALEGGAEYAGTGQTTLFA